MTVVIGTAGHIDHGKTTLLRALTGIDADRLPEERRRGMTIEVGYAHLAFDDGTVVDFVDVPGHEKLVGNMLVGAGEIDAVLLVVAADDGPRAQTIEHLGLVDALGLRDAVVALTKVDVLDGDPARLAERVAAVRELVDRSSLAGSPIVRVSALRGEGLDELRSALRPMVDRVATRIAAAPSGPARLAVDRVFSIKGRGTVATGSLRGGPVAVGDSLVARPAGGSLRVRELQVHNGRVERAEAGGRVALNVVGPGVAGIERGTVLTADPDIVATRRALVRLSRPFVLAPGVEWPPSSDVSVRVFAGTAHAETALGRGRTDDAELSDGSQVVTLRLATPMALCPGDRLVLRRPAPIGTVAGGIVLDAVPPIGPGRRRATAGRLAALARALAPAADLDAIRADPIRADAIRADAARLDAARLDLHGALPDRGEPGGWRLAPDVASACTAQAIAAVDAARDGVGHAELRGILARGLRRRVAIPYDAAGGLAARLVADAVTSGHLSRDGDTVRLPGRAAAVVPAETLVAMDRLEALLATPAPPRLAEAASAAACPEEGIRALEASGRIVRLGADLAWAAAAHRDLEAAALRLARVAPLTPAALRDATGTSRKYVMALLDDFDRRGVLRRTPPGHVPGPRAPR